MAQTQSERVRQIVSELKALEKAREDKQRELRNELRNFLGCGPKVGRDEVMRFFVDLFLEE